MSSNLGKKVIISLITFSILALTGVYYVTQNTRVSEQQSLETFSLAVNAIGSPDKNQHKEEQQLNGIRAFAKMFAKEESQTGYSDQSLLGPKGRYDEVYIGSRYNAPE